MNLTWKELQVLPVMDKNGLFLSKDRTSMNAYRGVSICTKQHLFQAVYNRPSSSKGYKMYCLGKFEDERVAAYYAQEFEADLKARNGLEEAFLTGHDEEFVENWFRAVGPYETFMYESMGYTVEQLIAEIEDRQTRCGDQKHDYARDALIKEFKSTALPPAQVVPHMIRAVESIVESKSLTFIAAAQIVANAWRTRDASIV